MKDRFMNGIGLLGLIGLLVCFGCTIAANVYDNAVPAHAVRIGWALSAGGAAISLIDSVYVWIRKRMKPVSQKEGRLP